MNHDTVSVILGQWDMEMPLLLVVISLISLYIAILAHNPSAKTPLYQPLCFIIGLFIFYLLFASPIDTIGEQFLFFVRLLQHLVLIYGVSHLLLVGIPEWLLRSYSIRFQSFQSILPAMGHPFFTLLVFNSVFYLWHFPILHEWVLNHSFAKQLGRFILLGASMMMWAPLLNPVKAWRLPPSGQMLYVLTMVLIQLPFAACLVFSKTALYSTYAQAPRLINLSPVQDQLIAGLILKLATTFFFSIMFLVAFLNLYRMEQHRQELTDLYTRSSSD